MRSTRLLALPWVAVIVTHFITPVTDVVIGKFAAPNTTSPLVNGTVIELGTLAVAGSLLESCTTDDALAVGRITFPLIVPPPTTNGGLGRPTLIGDPDGVAGG